MMPHKNCITMVLTKMRNDLKRPKTTCNDDLQWARNDLKRPTTTYIEQETTYNEQETTWNDPQRIRHNLQWPEPIYNEQKKTWNDQQQTIFQIIWQYGTNGPLLKHVFHPIFVAIIQALLPQRTMVKTERQTSLNYHVYFTRDIRFIFFCLGFASRTFTNHRTAEKGRGYFFSSSLPLPPTS